MGGLAVEVLASFPLVNSDHKEVVTESYSARGKGMLEFPKRTPGIVGR
jgi:hypothetical protein